ncbi:phage terminase small subunit P27 family [Nesterenkonia sp. E16_7]|uniref:phage terminase small subunit P27 family n=1 Tax=unclassified Nesterenkonia TaxID=2629769 RepID=UPI001A9399AA|nr:MULTISPECIES: phage terminase small subunit P27 family [unclassified Nesterenkonia]MBO0596580.1 phage terminase small subunit P27 family [Nesterenkonia sp. E16_10]MBO0598357.1 phage terminase small subunit P27 family [Nesterenkonia sp. E16_7]
MGAVAASSNLGRKSAPTPIRVLNGRGTRKDGQETDSGGRPVAAGVQFTRDAPTKPAELSEDAHWLWDRVVDQMTEIGLLKPIDAASLEAMCETFARWREAVRFRREHALLAKNSQGTVVAPWIGIEERASKEFRSWCAEYGITPAAEKHLRTESGGNDDDGNPF